MDKVDQQYLEELVKAHGEDVPTSAYDIKFEDDGNTIESILKMAEGMGKGDEALDNTIILVYLKVCASLTLLEPQNNTTHVNACTAGEKLHWGSGRFRPRNAKKSPRK